MNPTSSEAHDTAMASDKCTYKYGGKMSLPEVCKTALQEEELFTANLPIFLQRTFYDAFGGPQRRLAEHLPTYYAKRTNVGGVAAATVYNITYDEDAMSLFDRCKGSTMGERFANSIRPCWDRILGVNTRPGTQSDAQVKEEDSDSGEQSDEEEFDFGIEPEDLTEWVRENVTTSTFVLGSPITVEGAFDKAYPKAPLYKTDRACMLATTCFKANGTSSSYSDWAPPKYVRAEADRNTGQTSVHEIKYAPHPSYRKDEAKAWVAGTLNPAPVYDVSPMDQFVKYMELYWKSKPGYNYFINRDYEIQPDDGRTNELVDWVRSIQGET